MLLRLTTMRGIDLERFDFDYDLTWMGFFLDADGRVLGRYGGRDASSAEGRVSLAGLRHAMQAALTAHRAARRPVTARPTPPRTVEGYPASRRVPEGACVHCHQVYDFRREALQAAGKWRLDEVWVYPLPENVGLTLDVDRGSAVARVAAGSPAARVGLRRGDVVTALGERPVVTFADVQHALHRAPARGKVALTWQRGGRTQRGELTLAAGWRKTDVSWRWSLRGLDPPPWVQGEDLSAEEKKALGLAPRRLAFRQGPFVSTPARHAGIRPGDVIVGVDGKVLQMTARQFAAHVRFAYKVGDRVVYNVLRGGKRLNLPLKLEGR